MLIRKDENRSGCSGCFGCFGIVLLIILLFSGCSAIFGNSDEDDTEDTSPKTEDNSKKESETSDKEEKTSAKENVENDNTKTDSTVEKNEVTPEDDTVYGKLTAPHDNNKMVVVVDGITYVIGDNDEILRAEKSFSKLPLDKNLDKSFLNEHAKDLMAKDAEFVSNLSDTEQRYHSKSLNKDYYVTLVLNEFGKVNGLIVSSIQ
ncbi:hypothetical protein [Staphylococcus pseudintermedius]|uniref:hypothetical protein n=1 Tax=Staphylococcus pseudintermedius TaxID=283734 RepID=UPI001A0F4CCF|nr:hypothetical protein [Staphylococcus pseudintermedius]EGQ2730481.1 hypothetical protein [Staphylococcus pseudintermedius]EGQ4093374.1 hypothetical protein [Staphylococcus pseudintermedius]MDU0358245.1 hypothetical protein [Staphylococcus pseudintermedius]HCA6993093.1 hypothetical protein [Staphylococcus pseudintermedius]HDV5999494.1 hypothetical protein [Staphylococcus pseudintermedius]